MVLVDSSVLIPFLRGSDAAAGRSLSRVLDLGLPVALCPAVIQEVLQGCRAETEYSRVREYLLSQHVLDVTRGVESAADAARIFFDCRRAGVSVSSTLDCTIAQIALEHEVPLLHSDRDYVHIRRVRPRLLFCEV